MKLYKMIKGVILKRPSKICKSPYVADVLLENGEEVLAHAPSLGCCGICDKGSVVFMVPLLKSKICKYSIWLGQQNHILVGIYPKNAEKLTETYIQNILPNLKKLEREKKILNSRFDFVGIDAHGMNFVLEVKSVPLCENNIAYFPEGYRKNKKEVVSPRALKHIQELQIIKENNPDYRCILCFVVQREDATCFKINDKDKVYKDAIKEAIEKGIELITLKIKWDEDGNHSFDGFLNVGGFN